MRLSRCSPRRGARAKRMRDNVGTPATRVLSTTFWHGRGGLCKKGFFSDMELRPFQRRFLARALSDHVDTSVLSLPRGNGKSTLSAYILQRCLTPDDQLFEAGAEYLLGAASLEQARNAYRPLRAALEDSGEYRFIDSVTRLGITHVATNTKLRVMSSNAKTAFGIVGTPVCVLDEPGSWETTGGALMFDALVTAQGKPESRLRLLFTGTLAPSSSGWWTDLVDGAHTALSTYRRCRVNGRRGTSGRRSKRRIRSWRCTRLSGKAARGTGRGPIGHSAQGAFPELSAQRPCQRRILDLANGRRLAAHDGP